MLNILNSLLESPAILSLIVSCIIFLICFYKVSYKTNINIADIDEINTDLDILETFNIQNQKRITLILKSFEHINDDPYLNNIRTQLNEIMELLRHNCFSENNAAYDIEALENEVTLYIKENNI